MRRVNFWWPPLLLLWMVEACDEWLPSEVHRSCLEHRCIFDILSRWSSPKAQRGSGYFFEKVYIVHFTPRTWRRQRMIDRAAAVGIPTAPEDGVLAFVDAFDAGNFSKADVACLRGNSSLALNLLSVNAKHYAVMLDMLRHRIRYALILEDDARFDSGTKQVPFGFLHFHHHHHAPAKDRSIPVVFNVSHSFGATFRRTIEDFIVPHLPTLAHAPQGFLNNETTPSSEYVFDHLMLGACDLYFRDLYKFGKQNGAALTRGLRRGVVPFSDPINVAPKRSCTRCLIAYVASQSGAAKTLDITAFPWQTPIDIHIAQLSQLHRPLNCLWVEPPMVWEDPGTEGDGIDDAATFI